MSGADGQQLCDPKELGECPPNMVCGFLSSGRVFVCTPSSGQPTPWTTGSKAMAASTLQPPSLVIPMLSTNKPAEVKASEQEIEALLSQLDENNVKKLYETGPVAVEWSRRFADEVNQHLADEFADLDNNIHNIELP